MARRGLLQMGPGRVALVVGLVGRGLGWIVMIAEEIRDQNGEIGLAG
ncbi:hypothetical protein GCM10028818_18040 [Spirosoma horti]